MRGREQFSKYKKCIMCIVKIYTCLPLKMRLYLFELHRNTRGKIGIGIRYALLKSIASDCGDNVAIYPGAYILNPQYLKIGNNVSIHPMCYLECGKKEGDLIIENDVSIAHGTTIMSTSHVFTDKFKCIKDQGIIVAPVKINSDVWIGAKVTILSGVTIESGVVIGANSVVTKSINDKGIYVGAPARLINKR